MENTEIAIAASGIHFSFRDRAVLVDMSIEVKQGEIFGLLGPNGSGKSTFLKLLCGFEQPVKGHFEFRGSAFTSPPLAFREALGVVFQSPSLDEKLTAERNLYLAGRARGLSTTHLTSQIPALLERVGLTSRSHDLVETFSGGMKRKLDLARALLANPSILIMDEPSSGLDEASFRGLWERVLLLQEERELTVIVATHRPEEAEYCHRLAVLSAGKIQQVETPEGLRTGLSSDILVFKGPEPETLVDVIQELSGKTPILEAQGQIVLECLDGPALIPTIMSRVSPGSVTHVSLRRPGLGDAFLKITGVKLDGEESEAT